MSAPENFDVIVIGGGPAGSTVASFVAMQNHKVLLLDKDQHPRYQIGESLLPATIHGICAMLGVSEELKAGGFVLKRGGTWRWGASKNTWEFDFSRSGSLNDQTGYAYQVQRSRFDFLLLNNSRRKGVDVRERCEVREILQSDGRVQGLVYQDSAGKKHEVRARFVVDASGNTGPFHKVVGKRNYSDYFRNIALFCYWEGGPRFPAPRSGNALFEAFKEGWIWYIPISDKLTSVGAVIAQQHLALIQGRPEEAMTDFIAQCPLISEFLSKATRVTTGEYGKFRVRKDWSYVNERFHVPGMILVGDSACFVDPVISSGVHLATYGALQCARSLNTCLRDSTFDEEVAFKEYEFRYQKEYQNFYRFLQSFYDMNSHEQSYFWEARKVLQSPEDDLGAFVTLAAGVSNNGEQVFASSEEFYKSRRKEKGLDEQDHTSELWENIDNSESVRMIEQGKWGPQRHQDQPMYESGLIPSFDGFHWRKPTVARRAPAEASDGKATG